MVDFKHIEFLDRVFVRRPFFEASAYRVSKLRDVLKTNVFKNAIWLASPAFFNELEKKGFDYDLLSAKERLTALKFYNRMSFRGTPFGAFSAFGLAGWESDVKMTKPKSSEVDYTLHLLPSVQQELKDLQSKPLTDEVLIAVNPTLYRLNMGWRYHRYEEDGQGKLSFSVYLLAYDPADELILAQLAEKPLPLGKLIDYLVELTDCTREEGTEHMARLLDEQVLTSSDSLSLLINRNTIKHREVGLDNSLRLFDKEFRTDLGFGADDTGKSFYAGTEMRGIPGLPVEWQKDILEALEVLDLLAPLPPKNSLDKFREAFEKKFGERSVPLLEALDPDLGVAFDEGQHSEEHDLLKGLEFGQSSKKNDQITWTPVHQLLMNVWLQNGRRDKWEPVVLTADDVGNLPGSNLPFPPSTSVFCSLAQDKIVFHNIGGATANALTGRFSNFSDDFEAFCRSTASLEADVNPNVIFAEVLQVSHRKVDNINRRRQVYEHVIPLNCFPPERSILPGDIDVQVRGGEIMLVHRVIGKRVIPRLPTAFNYHHNEMASFRFLCALQFKSIRANFDFDPEKVFPGLNFYPRIEYGKTVLSLAKWHLNRDEIEMLTGHPLSISRLHLFCRKRGISPKISVGRGDQQLAFDLSDDEEAVFFLESLKDQENPVITEFAVDNVEPKKGKKGFNNQFVISLLNRNPVCMPAPVVVKNVPVVRDFDPGSEWIYLKVYATYQSQDHILVDELMPWINRNRDQINQWFFVRYFDEAPHLRIRFRIDLSIVKDIQHELQGLIVEAKIAGFVQKAYFDTYQREIERYSASLIGDVEEVFCRGSEIVATWLMSTGTDQNTADQLWSVVHCYEILSTFFASDWEEIIAVCQWAAQAFFQEHGGSKSLKRSMDYRYREFQFGLSGAFNVEADNDGLGEMKLSLHRLSQAAVCIAFDRKKLIADIIHMQINRIFKSEQRRHEAFIWHCLLKMSVSQSKRNAQVGLPVMSGL